MLVWRLKVESFLFTYKNKIKWLFNKVLSLLFLLVWKLRFFTISWWVNLLCNCGIILLIYFFLSPFLFKFWKSQVTEIDRRLILRKLKIPFRKGIRQIINLRFLIERIMVHTVLILMLRFVIKLRSILRYGLPWRGKKLWNVLFWIRWAAYKRIWARIEFYLLILN